MTPDRVRFQNSIFGLAMNFYSDAALSRLAIGFDDVGAENAPVPGGRFNLISEVKSGFTIAADIIIHEDVVGVLMSDRDAKIPVVLEDIVFESSVAHAPAQKQSDLPVMVRLAVAHDRMR